MVKKERKQCDSCQALMINGIFCHETGCPNAWKDYDRECKWCGQKFKPETKHQDFCCDDCAESYNW